MASSGKPWRRQRVGTVTRGSALSPEGRQRRGEDGRDVARTGETWRGRERRGEDGRDVPRTGETCRGRERRHCRQRVSLFHRRRPNCSRMTDYQRVGTAVRGSTLPSEGRHCRQRVGTASRGSALPSEGRHCRQRVGTAVRGAMALSGET